MTKKKPKIEKPTNRANLSQNLDKRRDLPAGFDRQAGQGTK
jgi:hypothetical protein